MVSCRSLLRSCDGSIATLCGGACIKPWGLLLGESVAHPVSEGRSASSKMRRCVLLQKRGRSLPNYVLMSLLT